MIMPSILIKVLVISYFLAMKWVFLLLILRSDQILRSFLQSNMHKKYIIFGTFWHRSLCVKTWYSSKIFVNMPSFWHKMWYKLKTWYKLIIWGIMSQNIYYKIFKAIQHRKTWYNLKFVLSNFLRVFFPIYMLQNI